MLWLLAGLIVWRALSRALDRWTDSWPEIGRDTWTKIVNEGGKR